MNRHLDILREIGFVQADQAGSNRRSWLWSAVPGGVRIGRIEGGDMEEAALEWYRAVVGAEGILLSQWPAVARSWPQSWRSAAEASDWMLHLTAAQLDGLAADLRQAVQKWKSVAAENRNTFDTQTTTPEDPDWVAPVVVVLNAIPYPREPQ